MALPSGYTKLDYIESSGTQYINTGFKPNQNTRVMMDVEVLGTTQCAPFGARASQSGTTYTLFLLTATTGRTDYGTSKQAMTFSSILGRYTIDANKNVVNVNGVSITHTASTFSVDHNIFLLAVNTAGTASNFAKVKLYSCKIYDNGTLVRDFIPCKNASGTIGLWDNVNSVFYANAGTGTFSTGTKHKTLIDGTGYEIKSGRVLIAGTGYGIKKGRTLIDGTGYDITFATPISELPVGTSVYADYNGVRTEFIVIQQGNPDPAIYDDSCNGTWLLIKDIFEKYVWYNNAVSTSYYYYDKSVLKRKLDTEVLNKFSAKMQSMIKQVKIPAMITGWNGIKYGSEGLDAKLFLLSATEILGTDAQTYDNDGAQLSYFAENTDLTTRIAYYNGTAIWWWLRSNRMTLQGGSNSIYVIMEDGRAASTNSFSDKNGNRFAFIMPSETLIDDNFNIIEE